MSRIAVIGGTGRVGRHVVDAVNRLGHEPVVAARSSGVDATDVDEMRAALAGVHAVVDVTNTATADRSTAEEFFRRVTSTVLAAEQAVGVRHHVALSIVGLDRVTGNAHYAGKRLQEQLVRSSEVPSTIVRATQFHDFGEMVVGWTRRDGSAVVPPLLVQPVVPADVADVLVRTALGDPRSMLEVAGPETQDLVDMARRTLAARGEWLRLVPTWDGPLGVDMAGNVLLPGPDAVIGPMTFDEWLAEQATPASEARGGLAS